MATKRTRKLLVWAICLHSIQIFAQSTFQKTLGGPGNESANWVVEVSNGFMVAGSVTNTTGNQDALLTRLDLSGNIVWQKRFGAGQADAFNCIVATPDGGVLATGETRSFGTGNADIFLVNIDVAGTIVWSKTIGNAGYDDVARCIVPIVGGGYLVSGSTLIAGGTAPSSVFIRLDHLGNTVWSRKYSSSIGNSLLSNYIDGNVIYASGGADNNAAFIRLDLSTGNILSSKAYAAGEAEGLSFQQPSSDGNLLLADFTHTASSSLEIEMWVQKIKPITGQTLWSKAYYRANDNIRGRIEKVNDGGFLLVPFDYYNSTKSDALLAKIDANGNLIWSYNYGGNASDRFLKAVQTADGGFIAVGDTRSSSINGNSDILIVKTDANGRVAGTCAKNAGIQSTNFGANHLPLVSNASNWVEPVSFNMGSLSLNLMGQGFVPNPSPVVDITIPLCPDVSYIIAGIEYFAPKLLTDTVASQNGCDTIYHYNLTLTDINASLQVIGLCPGETYSFHGVPYSAPYILVDTISSASGGCDTLLTVVLKVWAEPTVSQTVYFCPGETVMIGGQPHTQAGTVQSYIPSTTGGCDTLATYTLIERPQPSLYTTIAFCPGESVIIGGNTYTQSGTVSLNIPSTNGGGCDTIVTYALEVRPQPTRAEALSFCQGESVTIAGQTYNQSGTVIVNQASTTGGCDTIVTYTLELLPALSRAETRTLCPGESVTIAGQTYNQSGTVVANLASTTGGCDTTVTYTLELLPALSRAETRTFCPGESVTIAGQTYNQSGTVVANVASTTGGCDTTVTYTLELLPTLSRGETRAFCPGESVIIAGQTYNQPGSVVANVASTTGGCDTIVTYTLELLPQPGRAETHAFCPGESVTIAGQSYHQPGTVVANVASTTGGCDTIVTYTLELRPQPTQAEVREFCPGETLVIAGQTYNQPGTVVVNKVASLGCDTVVTYTLQHLTPAPSNIAIQCPNNLTVFKAPGVEMTKVNYFDPEAASDCICDGLQLSRISGPASGDTFPLGTTQICYLAKDICGQEKPCCFTVNVQEEYPCYSKVNGCMKYELLTITADPANNYTYRIRVTNNCPKKLIYTAIQIPDGLTTLSPANNSTYISPQGRKYLVRSPNYSPIYSIRFKSTSDSISNGESEVFEYTLPAQANVTTINITSRLVTQDFYEAHLSTYNCPVGVTPANTSSLQARDAEQIESQNSLLLFPNPTSGVFYADLSDWQAQALQVRVTNAQGQLVHTLKFTAGEDLVRVELPKGLSSGVYFLEVNSENGEKEVMRFVLQR